jgi:DNA-binding MarR family transcriptional regulator
VEVETLLAYSLHSNGSPTNITTAERPALDDVHEGDSRAMKHSHHHMSPPSLDGIDPASADVFAAFRRTMHLNRQLLARVMAEKGGHPGAAAVLRVLSAHDGISQRDLADALHLSRPTITAMLQKMEQHGLIERWDDEADQRLTRIRLTTAGRAQAQAFGSSFTEYIDCTIGAMPEDDRRDLARLLGALADTIEAALKRHGAGDAPDDTRPRTEA